MKITFITGAGVSTESGIPTYRDSDNGLWLDYKVDEVATHKGWKDNPEKVLSFHNMARTKLLDIKPNKAHINIAELSKEHDVWVITQNIDTLHEQAGSEKVLHLHGNIQLMKSSDPLNTEKYPYDKDIKLGDLAPDGNQLRPDVVLFGEGVPAFSEATLKIARADIVVVIGTSLQVYPAADLLEYCKMGAAIYIIDPSDDVVLSLSISKPSFIEHIKKPATTGIIDFIKKLNKPNSNFNTI